MAQGSTRLLRAACGLAALLALAGCLALPGAAPAPGAPDPNAVTVTTLPDTLPAGETTLPTPETLAQTSPETGTATASPEAQSASAPEAAAPARPDPELLACTREGGRMVPGPGGFGRVCITPTPDAGKACRSDDDCSGHCLARGNVCAPITPLMGCHDIWLSSGQRVTQCIQ
jgi:hypothetical protein